jgi:calcium-dependent protein kinase
MTVKLCDFGFATKSEQPMGLSKLVGSPYYIAPEVFSEAYDHRCDLWSAGVLLYYMLSHSFPFTGKTPEEIFHSIKKEKLNFEGVSWECVSEDAKDLISKLLVKSPDIRLTAFEALSHSFFKQAKSASASHKRVKDNMAIINPIINEVDLFRKVTTVHCAELATNH